MATKQGLGARGTPFLIVFAGSWFLPAAVPRPLRLGPVDAMGNDRAIYGDYATVPKTYVNDEGMVNYGGLKTHPDGLHAFAEDIAKLDE